MISVAVSLGGCWYESDVKSPTPETMESGDVRVKETELQAGHPVALELDINSTKDVESVPVAFYFIDKSDFDAAEDMAGSESRASNDADAEESSGPNEIKQTFAGYGECRVEASGKTECQNHITPDVDACSGECYLFADIDPLGATEETDTSDTRPNLNNRKTMAEISAVVTISDAYKETANIVLESLSLDEQTIILETHSDEPYNPNEPYDPYYPNEPPDTAGDVVDTKDIDISATLTVALTGTQDIEQVPVTMCIEIPERGCQPLDIWNSATAEYQRQYKIGVLIPGVPVSVHIGASIPGDAQGYIVEHIQLAQTNRFELKVMLDEADQITEYNASETEGDGSADNSKVIELTIVEDAVDNLIQRMLRAADGDYNAVHSDDEAGMIAAQQIGLQFSKGYKREFKNHYFGTGVTFSAVASLDDKGATGAVQGAVPFTIFGNKLNFLNLETTSRANPFDVDDSSFDLDVQFAGRTLYSMSGEAGFEWDKGWDVTKTKEYKTRFMISIVPMSLTAGASGTLGFDIEAAIADKFLAAASPYVDVGGSIAAAVDLVIASGGVEADLSLVKDTFTGEASADMALVDEGTRLQGLLKEYIVNDLSGPSGEVNLFAIYTTIRWCKSWGIPYPCGTRDRKSTKRLVSWSSFMRKDVLLNKTQSTTIYK